MKKIGIVTACLGLVTLLPAYASAGNAGMAVKASTLGGGVEIERTLSDNLGVRFGVNYFQIDGNVTAGDIKYDASVDLQTAGGFIDLYPFGGAFRLTAGVMYNGNEADITASPASAVTIGNTVYSPQLVGSLKGTVSFNDIAPYAGIGWSSGRGNQAGLSVAFDLGVLFQGSPSLDNYHATGPLAGNAYFQSQLDQEAGKVEDEIDEYQYYPVIALTLTYRF